VLILPVIKYKFITRSKLLRDVTSRIARIAHRPTPRDHGKTSSWTCRVKWPKHLCNIFATFTFLFYTKPCTPLTFACIKFSENGQNWHAVYFVKTKTISFHTCIGRNKKTHF